MSTVDKALSLLQHFSVQSPEFGLSELARVAGHDKTTILRCMTALERNGFVEQDSNSRKYRLGLGPIRLARIREQSFPLLAVLQAHLDRLVANTQETAHATVLIGRSLNTALIAEPDRATRVHVDPGDPLPVHATATGLVIAAHLPEDQRAALMPHDSLEAFTDHTPTDMAAINALIRTARLKGYARANQTLETDVIGTAVAFFGPSGLPVGAIAVAAVSSRFNSALSEKIITGLQRAGQAVTEELGGLIPASLSDTA